MDNFIYFFIYYPLAEKEQLGDIYFMEPKEKSQIPICIYTDEIFENNKYYYKKIFKTIKSINQNNKSSHYYYKFIIDDVFYEISFENKVKTFIFDVRLDIGKRECHIKRKIDQNKIEYSEKLELFIKALEGNGEKEKIDELYKNSIELFSKKKRFSLLISLFVKIYKNKDLCNVLLKKFRNNKADNDRKEYLKNYTSNLNEILLEADKLINNNNYDIIDFYGIILSYLNYYDYENFSLVLDKLFAKNSINLFEILIIYNTHFTNPINQNIEFLNKFISYTINNKAFSIFRITLSYIEYIEDIIFIIEHNKEKIFEKYNPEENIRNIIIIGNNIKFKNEESLQESNNNKNKLFLETIKNMNSIINFSKSKNIFFIYFNIDFWNYILNYFQNLEQINIWICFEFRKIFINYYELLSKKGKNKDIIIYYFERDEFAIILDKIIWKYIKNNDLASIEKLGLICKYNPYYIEEKYKNKLDCKIFDLFDLNDVDDDFIDKFRHMNFEIIFKDNINEYITKIISKIKNISNFEAAIKLINIKNIQEKKSLLNCLNKIFDDIIVKQIEELTDEIKIKKVIEFIADFAIIYYIYTENYDKLDFIERIIIRKLNKKLITHILIEIMNIIIKKENVEEEEMKGVNFVKLEEFIFHEFCEKIQNMDDFQNIINLINCLERKKNVEEKEKSINKFLNELFKKNFFTKVEFFSQNENIRITLLYELYEKGKIKMCNEEYYGNIFNLIDRIKGDIESYISKNEFEKFLKNDKTIIIKRLSLFKIILESFNPIDFYNGLKTTYEEINKKIKQLKYIKYNIKIYHSRCFSDIIEKIKYIIIESQKMNMQQFIHDEKIKKLIDECRNVIPIVDLVQKIKNFLLFNVIYEMNSEKDERKKFEKSNEILNDIGLLFMKNIELNEIYKKHKEIFDKVREKLGYDEEIINKLIEDIKNYYNINNQKLINELNILFKSKIYEKHINSMIFFFDFFEKDNNDWNNKLSDKYKNISQKNFEEMKNDLNELKNNDIYNYQENQNYFNIFTSLYNKKEAIEYLFSRKYQNIDILKDRIQSSNCLININDIKDTEACLEHINQMKNLKNNFEIYSYIKRLNQSEIEKIINYSHNFISIIDLDINYDSSKNILKEINNIIKEELIINIYQDSENIIYYCNNKDKIKNISMKELINIKNKIDLRNNNDTLLFFRNIIDNLETINEYMNALRIKGNSLPIKINIRVKMYNIKYYLEDKEVDLEKIKTFLIESKNTYNTQLDFFYKHNIYIRFLYGKQFRSILRILECGFHMESFLRYILNIVDSNKPMEEGNECIVRRTADYFDEYELYNKDSLENISNYIFSLFDNNNKSIKDHYENMKIISEKECKGIYSYKCNYISIEECIINLFWAKLNKLPVTQNILIISNETSYEEMEAFLNRAILCNYNTLFVIGINNSFSEQQIGIVITLINQLLSYKFEERCKNKTTDKIFNKIETKDYMESCLVFVYEKNNEAIIPLLRELKLFMNYYYEMSEIDDEMDENYSPISDNKFLSEEFKNIKVISSDICGLGKSEKIKKEIKDIGKQYFHLALGATLTRNIIFNKLNNILIEIKNENNKYENVAIHLDLYEFNDNEILNEFLFSFLITKFYINNGDIIYIPKDIYIYIEIPNCYENFLPKFHILNIFKKENITFENLPNFNYPNQIIDKFNRLLNIDSNDKLQEFVKKHIGLERYSFYQINIFIKLFISQFDKFKSKLVFSEGNQNITEKILEDFAKSTLYFTSGGFSKLLTNIIKFNNDENKSYIDILSDIYNNDLQNQTFPHSLMFINKENMNFERFNIEKINSYEFQNSKDYLKKMKILFNIPNEIDKDLGEFKSLISILDEKDYNYIITDDNFKKMILLYYRIKANIPVIIMGEEGCGKLSLIFKLNELLNNGKRNIEIININPEINDEKLYKIMERINEKAKNPKEKELWIYFNKINTCKSQLLLTEIFNNKTYNDKKISDNIRLIGACHPYRFIRKNIEQYGLSLSYDIDIDSESVYIIEPLPQSLLYYVFNFGSICEDDEKKYIYNIIGKIFNKEENYSHEKTTEAIFQCHRYFRQIYDPSAVSLRDISRFLKIFEFFIYYYTKKNECENRKNNELNNKIRSIICSIYINYYMRLTNIENKYNFESQLQPILLQLINNGNFEGNGIKLLDKINYKDLKDEIISRPEEKIYNFFSDFIRIEQDYLINQINIEKGIGKTSTLKKIIFLSFISISTNIPLIIIGKPGSSKTLSIKLIIQSMKGKCSENKFFRLFQRIIPIYFHGSELTKPEDIEYLFNKAEIKLDFYKKNKKDIPKLLILFDEIGLAQRSESNPFKILNSKLESIDKEDISFIGISNYTLDTTYINKNTFILSIPNLDEHLNSLIETSRNIVDSISPKLKNDNIFEILSRTYFEYKNILHFIKKLVVLTHYRKIIKGKIFREISNEDDFIKLMKKERKINIDFHCNIDFYNLIKEIVIEFGRLDEENSYHEKVEIIIRYIERNFDGIKFIIDIDFNIEIEDIKDKLKEIKNVLGDFHHSFKYMSNDSDSFSKQKSFKIYSNILFKKIYNLQCDNMGEEDLKIKIYKINEYNINHCIYNNVMDINSRYLLIETEQTLTTLLNQVIKLQNCFDEIKLYNGNPSINNDKEYIFNIINEIQKNTKEHKLIIIDNINQIHPFLFDLYKKNYQEINDKKYARIYLNNIIDEKLTEVKDSFKIIIFVEKRFMNNCNLIFLNQFEKRSIYFYKLLDDRIKSISSNIINEFNFRNVIRQYKDLNYSLNDLLINCRKDDIHELIYYLNKEFEWNNNGTEKELNTKDEENYVNILKEKVANKIYKILPQDIIVILPDNNIIKKKYIEMKNIICLKDYINDKENKIYKISIIYTFSGITDVIEGLNPEMSFDMVKFLFESGGAFKRIINEKKIINENQILNKEDYIYMHLEQSDIKYIEYISNYILQNYKADKYNYIIIIHINRNFGNHSDNINYLLDINPNINQLFIDDLNGKNNLTLKDILANKTKDILSNDKKFFDLDKKFYKTLKYFLTRELNSGSFIKNYKEYIDKIINYMKNEEIIKDKIIGLVIKLIDNSKEYDDSKNIIDLIYKNKIINKYHIDIISCFKEYIIEEIFTKYLIKIFLILEDNNIFTTLSEIETNNYKYLERNTIEDLLLKYLEGITIEKCYKYKCKFLLGYNIPTLYNFYSSLSNYININIKLDYSNNENDLREELDSHIKIKREFYKNEKFLLDKVFKEFENNYENILYILDKISIDLIFKDYIIYYLKKYNNNLYHYNIDDIYNKIIEILIKLRFNKENEIMKNNNKTKILLIKIIWIESNVEYIINILKIIEMALKIFNYNEKILFDKINELINTGNINYITNKNRNPPHTKEVNECYYILLASICYSITSNEIQLIEFNNNKKSENNNIEINKYYSILKDIINILQKLDYDLFIFLYEKYIISELIYIIELFKNNNITKINEIKNIIRESCFIIQEYALNNDEFESIQKLLSNFEKLDLILSNLENKNEKYYNILTKKYSEEIKKLYDTDYRYVIMKKILEKNEIVKRSIDIFQILLDDNLEIEDFRYNRNIVLYDNDTITNHLEKELKLNLVLKETMLYLLEKKSLIYIQNAADEEKKATLKTCIIFLDNCVKKPKNLDIKFNELNKLFCIGYIKVYIYNFIKKIDEIESYKEIIDNINGEEPICKMIRIYIYKILYNKFKMDFINNENNISKYKLKEFKDFDELKKNIFVSNNNENIEENNHWINLLKEEYTNEDCPEEKFPFYKYFYYTDYLNEEYILEKLLNIEENKYPVLKLYLKQKKNDNFKKVKKFYIFNTALNLINQHYYNKISKENAEKIKLKDTEIYYTNKNLINKFIGIYNELAKPKGFDERLNINKTLNDFFIDYSNNFGRTYIDIYKYFIKLQNDNTEKLLDIKIAKGLFDATSKNRVNIQQINDEEIFNLKLPRKNMFINLIFNYSYRKVFDTLPINYKLYNEYFINFDKIEEIMTDLLLKGKKLLNEDITEFIYENKTFDNQIITQINIFKKNYICKNINLDDKVVIYKFCEENKNTNLYKIIINDFFELLKFLNYQGKENKIEGDKKISNIIYELEDLISKYSIKLFEAGDNFTIDKLYDIFDYFLKVIFKDIINEMKTYQEELDYYSKRKIKKYRNKYIFVQDLTIAIRLFIELILFLEDNKENIKLNKNNIINYLNSSAYWDNNLYNNNEFENNLNELKSMDLKINQIIYLYKYLNKNSNEYLFDDVKQIIYGEIRKNSSSSSSSSSETEEICCGSPERVTHCFRGCRLRRKKEEDECSSD